MKRLLGLILAVVMFSVFAVGCGEDKKSNSNKENGTSVSNKKEGARNLYNGVDFSKYIELGEYKGIVVDTTSKEFAEYSNKLLKTDADKNTFYTETTLNTGKIENGDIANIDYEGKKDGIAFAGGTAKGHDLEIGSGSFIPGFEEGLIGVEIGKTVDLNLTFPTEYHSADLAGKAVVFTVKVNSVKRKIYQKPEEYYSKLGFKSVDEYLKDLKKRTIDNYLLDTVVSKSKVKDYPKEDLDFIFETTKQMMEAQIKQYYNVSFEQYLNAMGLTKENFIDGEIKPMMNVQMVLYAVLDKEGLNFTQADIDAVINEIIKESNDSSLTKEKLLERYGEVYFEERVVTEKVMALLLENAQLK